MVKATNLPYPMRAKLSRYEKAVRDQAFIGMQHPLDHESIEIELRRSRKSLEDAIIKLLPDKSEKIQCIANNLRGTRCKNEALSGSLCRHHYLPKDHKPKTKVGYNNVEKSTKV